MQHHIKVVLVVVFCSLLLGASISVLGANNLEKVTFRLNWISAGEGDHASFFVAQERGYYEDVGLDVTIQQGSGAGPAVTALEAGQVDIALSDFPTIAVARAKGADIKIVAAYQVNSPNSTWTRKDTGIKEPKDLAGHTIGAPAGDAQRIAFPAFAQAVGLDPNSVEWINIHPAAKIQSLAAGKIDATVHFSGQLFVYRDAIGEENLVVWRWAELGVNPYGLAIITTEQMLNERPDVIRRFLEATFRGMRETLIHPREAVITMQKSIPEIDVEKVLSMLEVSIKFQLFSQNSLAHGLGWIDHERMQASVDLINTYFDIPRQLTSEEMYTLDLLPQYSWPYPDEFDDPSTWPYPREFNF
jgi:NitT/TauT family transport system substrate-binding protein